MSDRISMIDIETYHVKSKPHVRLKLENKYSLLTRSIFYKIN